ncbi:MAG: PorV/PorQ family protein [candidate division Zixibacteria bacterium]|nr:PorV/PorQ family protein [candidate division Zixibacteria bacterium]
MRKLVVATMACLLIVGAVAEVNAQVSRAGVIFLLLPPGARASAMGDAFTSIADDATATYWNPAGLGRYPLSPAWFEFSNDTGKDLREIAILKNGLPDNNFRQYDTWALLGNRLASYNGEEWSYGETYYPGSGENAEDIARRFSGIDDEDSLKVLKRKLASVNMDVEREVIEQLSETIMQNIPEDYGYAEDVEYSLESLLNAWEELTIDKAKFRELRDLVDESLEDGEFSTLEFDKVTFSINNAISIRLPDELRVPYDFVLPDTINSLSSDGEELWVGTPSGLYKYNARRWITYTTEDSLISNDVTCVAFGRMNTVWIGTSEGISRFAGRNWTSFTTENGLPSNTIKDIAVGKMNEVWVLTDAGIAKLEGNEFNTFHNYRVNVGEDISRIATKYLNLGAGPALDEAIAKIEEANAFDDTSFQAGVMLKIPYDVIPRDEVTELFHDDDGYLWVGTTSGLAHYDNESWHFHGMKRYAAKSGDSAESIARSILGPNASQDNVDLVTQRIAVVNRLDTQSIDGGDNLYVPASPVASEILSIGRGSASKLLVGTSYGTFRRSGDDWKRYIHAGLEDDAVIDILEKDGEVWLATEEKLVINAHAKREMSFMHSNWLPQLADDIYFEYLSYVQNIRGVGTLGGAITFLSYGEQQRTGEQGEDLGTFFSYEMAIGLSYGASLNDKLSVGVSAKFIHSHLSDQGAGREVGSGTASSFAIDGGMLWKMPVKKLTMGLTVTNLGPDISYIDAAQADPLPRNLTLGFAYELFRNPYNKLTLVTEASKQLIDLTEFENDDIGGKISEKLDEVITHFGAEYWYGTFLALRGGFVNDKAGHQRYFTLGAGLQYTNYRFDFSYIPSTNEDYNRLGNTMRFSMTAKF